MRVCGDHARTVEGNLGHILCRGLQPMKETYGWQKSVLSGGDKYSGPALGFLDLGKEKERSQFAGTQLVYIPLWVGSRSDSNKSFKFIGHYQYTGATMDAS